MDVAEAFLASLLQQLNAVPGRWRAFHERPLTYYHLASERYDGDLNALRVAAARYGLDVFSLGTRRPGRVFFVLHGAVQFGVADEQVRAAWRRVPVT
jgi:hypothetical protein